MYVVLSANDGNVKRTARETGIPENTVRRWRNEFKNEPPSTDLVETAVTDFITDVEKTRNLSLQRIHERLASNDKKEQGTLPQLATVFGVLTDKIDRAQGLVTKVEHEHRLNPSDIREALVGFVQDMRTLSESREEEIQEAEIIEQPALPPAR